MHAQIKNSESFSGATLNEFVTTVMDDDDPRAVFTSLANKVFPPVFKSLKHGLTVDIAL